jgi:APA family basic amino acid/polyamine antiporter
MYDASLSNDSEVNKVNEEKLHRELTVYDIIAIGVGSVIGSGIFILFRTILRLGGKSTFMALLLAAIPNILTALAYAELGAMYQRNDVEYKCVEEAFSSATVATCTTYILLFFMIFNTATVLLFIGTLLKTVVKEPFYITVVVLFVLSLINYFGIEASKTITNSMGVIEITILSLVGLCAIQQWSPAAFTSLPKTRSESSQFWMASFLSLFLYSGYDAVVKLSEETINPGVDIPSGIMISVGIVTVLYLILSVTATSVFKDITKIESPIRELYQKIIHKDSGVAVTMLGILIVVNTAFIGVISMSRFIYGLSKDHKLPSFLQEVNARFKTPHHAVIAVFVSMAFALLIYHPERSASIANLFFLLFMITLMVCVILLRFTQKDRSRPFRIPGSVHNVPVLMVVGICICVVYMIYGCTHFWEI